MAVFCAGALEACGIQEQARIPPAPRANQKIYMIRTRLFNPQPNDIHGTHARFDIANTAHMHTRMRI